MTIDEAHKLALEHHKAGRLAEAEALYGQILSTAPQHADAWHLYGVLAQQCGHNDRAVEWIGKAIALRPDGEHYRRHMGIALQALGRQAEALQEYQVAVAQYPNDASAFNNLGTAYEHFAQHADAIAAYQESIRLQPDLVEAHNNLGVAYRACGHLQAAVEAYRSAIQLSPQYAEAHNNLGCAYLDGGAAEAAVESFRAAVQLRPNLATAQLNLGNALVALSRLQEAVNAFHSCVQADPNSKEALVKLGDALNRLGRNEEAVNVYRVLIERDPESSIAYNNLGNALKDLRRYDEAIAAYKVAIEREPNYAVAYSNLCCAYRDLAQSDDAVEACQNAIRCRPDFAEAYNNLACALKDRGSMVEAVEAFRQGHRCAPQIAQIQSNLIYTMIFVPGLEDEIQKECARWNQCYSEPVRHLLRPHPNTPDPKRKLKIGYVSPDFCDHVVGRNMLPLFKNHDRSQFEIYCYAQIVAPDAITAQFQQHCDGWRGIMGATDEQVSNQIRQDGIDILLDLALHMAHSRLPLFALKPAPIQATFAGYPGSTGLDTIDYRITDVHLDPPGGDESAYSEESWRLPDSFWCFDPIEREPAVNALPALTNGYITFGCLNNFCKVNDGVLASWARVMNLVPNSKLSLLSHPGSHREGTKKTLEKFGIDPSRVDFGDPRPRPAYLARHNEVDIILDTFPYNGHTTNLDGLWMGVPIVTLAQKPVVSRAGLSILTNLGVPEWIAHNEDDFVRIAVDLASDLPRLAEWRASIRPKLEASVLMDAKRFTSNIETAFRTMWERWCAKSAATPVS